MKKYIKVDWPDSQSILEYSKNVYNINDSQSIFIDENEYNIIKEYKKLDKYLKTLKDKDILYVEDKYKNNWIIVFKEYKDHKIHSYCSHCINTYETYANSQEGIFANLLDIKLITIANNEHLKQVKDDKYLKLYLNKEESFKDGDIVVNASNKDSNAFIYAGKDDLYYHSYVGLTADNNPELVIDKSLSWVAVKSGIRFATEEEKQKLFDAIKTNGYKWNAEIKTLEKLIVPKFKAGDKIEKCSYRFTITEVKEDYYLTKCGNKISIENQDDFNLISDKFNINTLKSFESRVLVRDVVYNEWEGAIFGRYDGKTFFTIGGLDWKHCIPYEGNEHLLGTTDDCSSYYKTWE